MTIRNKLCTHGCMSAVTAAMLVLLTGCVVAPPPRPAPPPPDKPITDVYAYPQNNQTRDQQERDRYECNAWAVQQSGFDPSGPNVPPHDRYRVVAMGPAPGSGHCRRCGYGRDPGCHHCRLRVMPVLAWWSAAVAGGAVGTVAEQQQRADAQAQAQQINDARSAQQMAVIDANAARYRRALGACLEGRGYSVK